MLGERPAGRSFALKRSYSLRLRCRLLGRQFVFGRGRFQLFELELHLLQQSRLALRAMAVQRSPQLLDLELEMTDQCFGARQIRLGVGRFGARINELRLGSNKPALGLERARRARQGAAHARQPDRWEAIRGRSRSR